MDDQRPTSAWSHLFDGDPEPPRRRRPRWAVLVPVVAVATVLAAVAINASLSFLTGIRWPWAPEPQDINPFAGHALYVDPDSATARAAAEAETAGSPDAAVLRRLAEVPQGVWLVPEQYGVDEVADAVERVVDRADDAVPLLVVYGIPGRDCTGGFSAGGLPADDYLPWVEQIAAGLDRADRAALVLEPDALLAVLECADGDERLALLREAVGVLADSRATVYVDAGHSAWQPARVVADLLRDVGVDRVRGFATNVANSRPEADEYAYAREVATLLGAGHALVDVGRSGGAPGETFCNPPDVALGPEPAALEDPVVDARAWVKPPGESDGTCGGGPQAGVFWPEQALRIARAAGW